MHFPKETKRKTCLKTRFRISCEWMVVLSTYGKFRVFMFITVCSIKSKKIELSVEQGHLYWMFPDAMMKGLVYISTHGRTPHGLIDIELSHTS